MSVFILIPNKGDGKEISNHCTFALISHTSKILLKVFQAGLRQYMNQEIKNRWEEYTKELYKKRLDDTDNHDREQLS